VPRFCLYLLKVKGAVKNFKNAQWFYFYFFHILTILLLAKPQKNWTDSPFNSFGFEEHTDLKLAKTIMAMVVSDEHDGN
jgi:uncharacterized membrane protein YcgQ (UPF0703/DUF1980 family)